MFLTPIVNPLMPELNPFEQGSLPEFYTGDIKCNAIKFGNLLMNWLIREKMFTYFYNKFRLVNRMHYIKYNGNISLLAYFWLLQKVCGTLDHCFIMIHIHNEGVLKI
jgi:hypothetical protein